MLNVDGPKTSGSGQDGFDVKVTGDARVSLIGFPSVAKSTLLTKPNFKTFLSLSRRHWSFWLFKNVWLSVKE